MCICLLACVALCVCVGGQQLTLSVLINCSLLHLLNQDLLLNPEFSALASLPLGSPVSASHIVCRGPHPLSFYMRAGDPDSGRTGMRHVVTTETPLQ